MATDHKDGECRRFPPKEQFCRLYDEHMPDRYLAEKTCPESSQFLAGKNVKYPENIIPMWAGIATEAFSRSMCSDPKSRQCAVIRMNGDIHFKQIQKALIDMSEKCDCE